MHTKERIYEKLILSLWISTSSLLLVLVLIGRLFSKRNLIKKKSVKFKNIPKNIKIMNVGTSNGLFGFVYENEYKDIGFNFSTSDQSFNFDYKILKKYKDRFDEDCTVFISVSIFSFYKKEKLDIERENLISILNFCKENKIKPILITTPVSYAYNEIVTKDIYKEKIYNHLDYVLSKIDFEVQYLDYSREERISNNLDYFHDSDHLNESGAREFMKIVLENVKVSI
ncbi:MAG: hypothetical protein ACRCZI_02130 [Cetobacterium sp.]